LVPDGGVDCRDIREVKANDLKGYRRCHFFSGILGWCEALRLAGWPESRPVWTASLPCQPFSVAGRGGAEEDPRHLWPVLAALVRECRPDCLVGEQVGSTAGREWLDGVRADLEAAGYAFGAADFPACSAGAPHIRQRLFWVATRTGDPVHPAGTDAVGAAADADRAGRREHGGAVADGAEQPAPEHGGSAGAATVFAPLGAVPVLRELPLHHSSDARARLPLPAGGGVGGQPLRDGFWDAFDVLDYRDGKRRRVEPGTFPLAHGIPAELVEVWLSRHDRLPPPGKFPGRVGLLRGYGNAIVPQVAAAFLRAFLAAESELLLAQTQQRS
jgi:DNA (cytosine-5)-methyltransferase 1